MKTESAFPASSRVRKSEESRRMARKPRAYSFAKVTYCRCSGERCVSSATSAMPTI